MTKNSVTVVLVLVVYTNAIPILEQLHFGLNQISSDDAVLDAEMGRYFEGDMILTRSQMRDINRAKTERNGLRDTNKRWPNRTVVYHVIKEDFDDIQKNMIDDALNDIANKSCLKFRVRENKEEHAVIIQGSGSGCYSNVGLFINKNETDDEDEEDGQVLNLDTGCFKHGTIVHEMLHTLGFYHMQSTYDRDNFIEIVWDNIRPGREHNFAKYTIDTLTDFDVPYDYGSVMHYPTTAFSINGSKTIIPLKENVKIGQRDGLSESDILKLNRMYCEENKSVSAEAMV